MKAVSQQIEPLLANLANSAELVSFEMIATGSDIFFQIACGEFDLGRVRSQLEAHLPELELRSSCDGLGIF